MKLRTHEMKRDFRISFEAETNWLYSSEESRKVQISMLTSLGRRQSVMLKDKRRHQKRD
jgi:hypothetical protein